MTESIQKALARPVPITLPDGSIVMLTPLDLNDLADYEAYTQQALAARAHAAGLPEEHIKLTLTVTLGDRVSKAFAKTLQSDRYVVWLSLRKGQPIAFSDIQALAKHFATKETLKAVADKIIEITTPPAAEPQPGAGEDDAKKKEPEESSPTSVIWPDFAIDRSPKSEG